MLKPAAAAALSTLVVLAVFELLLRIFHPLPLVVPINARYLGVAAPAPSVRSRVELPGQYDTIVTTNAQRFRMPQPTPIEPPRGKVRIAMLGDSVAFGVGANDDETYPAAAGRLLGGAEVINAGVIGTGTGEQVLWYERWVSRFHPKIVVLNVFFNDVDDDRGRKLVTRGASGLVVAPLTRNRWSAAREWVRTSRPYTALVAHSQIVALLRAAAGKMATHEDTGATDRTWFQTEGLSLQTMEIGYLNDLVASNKARLVVVSIPVRESFYADATSDPDVKWKSEAIAHSLAAFCTAKKIAFLDPTEALRDKAGSSPSRLYFTADSHLTPAGYSALASIVASFLQQFL